MLSVATAAVVVMAVTATGFPVNHVAANDGGVWVTNNNPGNGFRGTFAEYNAPIKQLGYSFGAPGDVPPPSYDLDVLQEGTAVLAVDRSQGAVYPVDSHTGTADASAGVTFPSDSHLALGGGVAAILRPGTPAQVWAAPVGSGPSPSVAGLNPATAKPNLKVPGAAAVVVDQAGDVFVASRTELVTLPFSGGALKPAVATKFAQPLSSVTLTAVGTTPVILDTAERVIHFPSSGLSTTLPAADVSGQAPVLQQAGPADTSVLVATDTALISVPLSGQAPSTLAPVPHGRPASPVRLDGCAYAVWASSPAQAAQVCESGGRTVGPLPGMAGQSVAVEQPVLRVNHDQIVLNDAAAGNTWIFAGRPSQVLASQDWLRVLVGSNPKNSNSQQNPSTTPEQDKQQPKLDNPTLYARAGRDSILHVLDHDTDPGGSILSIVNVTPATGPGFSVRVAPDTQNLVLSLQPGMTAPVTFNYQVVDGFGLTATGPVTIQPTSDQKPPLPPANAPITRSVVSGGTVSLQVLGEWRSPQNDPLSLADASVPVGSGQVTWTGDGIITFSAASVASDTPLAIAYHVTDGRSAAVAGQIPLKVLGRGDVTAVAPTGVPDALKVLINQPTAFSPLANDIFGADPNDRSAKLKLSGPVGSTTGLSVATNVDSGQVTFTASRSGAYSIKYAASYGSGVSAPTQILVQAVDPSGTVQPPVTSPQSLLLRGQYPASLDVLAGDYDPAGGLLTVVGVTSPPGLQVTVVQGEFLRISAVTSDPPANQLLTYQVTNGRTDPVTGQVSVLWEPAPPPQAPIVPDTYATVRAGDEVDVRALASAGDPDGESVHLLSGGAPASVDVSQTNPGVAYPTGLGSASISGTYLRYSAPSGTGMVASESVTVSYVVESQSGDRTTGHTYITIVPNDPASTTAPEPTEVDARVTAGGTVTIPIPTSGVDPDGDSVTLTGIASAPQLGRIMSFNTNSIVYQAFPFAVGSGAFSGGTDSFTYQVEGPSGLSARALVRVGVSPPAQAQSPIAADHFVTAAPGDQVDVDLLSGAYVTPGDQVTVQDLSKTNTPVPTGVTLVGTEHSTLQATTPSGATPMSVAYGIGDGTTAPSIAHVLIRSEPGYITPPVAVDYYPAAPTGSAKTITVDVLARDTDPGGNAADLSIIGSPVSGVQVSGPNLTIPVAPHPRAVPYVIRSGVTKAIAVGVVHVLGVDMGPQLRADGTIHVPQNGSTSVNIGDYITESGHQIRLTTTDQVSSAPSGGLGQTVTGNSTVTLTGLSGYVGPGSLTVQVIDSPILSTPGARTATFSIPVVVGSPTPVVRCPAAPVTVVQSGPPVFASIASVCQVWTPDGSSPASVTFTEKWDQVAAGVGLGWQSGQTGHVISLVADSGAKGGSTGSLTIGVEGGGPASSSTLNVAVVAAPPPSAAPANPAPIQSGQTSTIDFSQYVTSPLSQPNIYVVSVRQTSGSPTPATSSGSVVRISPATGTHGTLSYAVSVSDQGPNRPDRLVNDSITLQVIDVPSAPTGLQGVPGNGQVALSWDASAGNGAPVEHYIVSMGGASQQAAGTSYTWTGLKNGSSYTFTVTAVNQVGSSVPSTPGTFSPRAAPDAPATVTATTVNQPQGTASVTWMAANPQGDPITGYTVYVSPSAGAATTMQAGAGQTSLIWSGLSDAVGPYTFTVIARNSVGTSPSSPPSNPVYAHGVPDPPPAPTAIGQVSTDQASTTVVVSWPAISNCNDAQPCASYVVTELRGGSTVTTNTNSGACSGGSLCASFGPISNDGSSYTYTLQAVNREGQTSPAGGASSPGVLAVGAPAKITDLTASPANTTANFTFTLPAAHGSSIVEVKYTATGGSSPVSGGWNSPGGSGQNVSQSISGLVNGTSYSVTVSACNESGKCGPSSNAATVNPYGPPNPPSVTAAQSGNSIVYGWSGGGNNGRPVASYEVCIDGNCSSKGAGPSTATIGYMCSSPTHSVYAYVVDSVGQKSGNSTTASAVTQQCAPPGAPAAGANANGNTITWSWSGGGGSGLPIANYVLCVDGGCSNVGASPGSTNQGFNCGQTHSAYTYVVDSVGQRSNNSNTASATTQTCPVQQQVTISWGNKAPASDCQGDTSCTDLNISWAGFGTGGHTITPTFDGKYWGAASVNRGGSSGSYNGGYWAGYCGSSHSVVVTVDGVASNTISTNQHGC